jgi:Domain of unknown function (DUF4166)/Saccharopine dehydrogenase NADP binding domain
MSMRVLIVGGYGVFGGRIVDLLKDEARLTLIVAGRSRGKARAFCAARLAAADLQAVQFDRDGDVRAQIAALAPTLLIDASGPFQAYGAGCYRIVEACVARRVNYLDLADGADFVAGIGGFDDAARAAGIHILSGVSSFPVLTAAVVRRLARDLARVDAITGGIAPSPYAGVGENVIRAIASYAGRKVALHNGAVGHPFTERRRFTIAPPGRLPLKNTLFSLVDVPDLRVLPALWPEAKCVWMGAGPAPEILHRTLIACAWLVRLGVVRSLSPLAPLMHWVTNRVRWGEHRGGMFVEVTGARGDGAAVKRSWHMLAEGDDGPFIPSMAVEALVRRQLDGHLPAPGARACVAELELEDYERLFARRAIFTGVREAQAEGVCLYQRILGGAWSSLPAQIRTMHDGRDGAIAEGRARVERGAHPLAKLAAMVMGFPRAGEDIPVRVDFAVRAGRETWRRDFAGRRFQSEQFAGAGRSEALLCERFGPLTFAMALVVEGARLNLAPRRWTFLGVALPLWLAPRFIAFESVENGAFSFHVEISHPLIGLIVRYRGQLRRREA